MLNLNACLDRYIVFIIDENNLEKNQILIDKSNIHFNELDLLVKVAVHFYLLVLNGLSRIIFFRKLTNLNDSKILKLKGFLFLFNFFINKIDQILFVIASIHAFGKEEINLINNRETSKENHNKHYRFIVLGSGPSGSVTALELEKKYPGQVLLIERGNHHSVPQSKHPGDEFIKKWYRGGINSTYFPSMVAYTSGACYGGGSEINSGLYHEPDREFLQSWTKEFRTKYLTTEIMEPYIKKVSALTNRTPKDKTLFSKKFEEGALLSSNKYSYLPRFLDASGNRNSMSETLLKEYVDRDGKIKLGYEVEKIFLKKDKWFLKSKADDNLFSCDNLFICCGSVFTNNLLLKSRVIKRNKKRLKSFKFHPMIKIIASYDEELQELNDDIVADQNIEFYPEFIIGNASSSLQFLVSSFNKNKLIKEFIYRNWKKMKVFHATFSLGSGRIHNIPFLKEPVLTYHLSKSDKMKLYEGFMKTVSFIKSTSAYLVIPVKDKLTHNIKEKKYDCLVENIKNIKNFQLSSVHILGGVTMGEDKNCVVNSYGKVFDTEGLYVNDSSLINTPLLKNPQGTVMSIAYRNIDHFITNNELH